MQILRDQLQRPVWPVHRLDKGTSGVLVFALNADAARTLSMTFEAGHTIHKTYDAIVRGWPPEAGVIDHPLRRLADDQRGGRIETQPAITLFAVDTRYELPLPSGAFSSCRAAHVVLNPETGRRHQLRRHMKHISHPIIGDATHGKGPLNRAVAHLLGLQRLWLHARELTLTHPVSGDRLTIQAPLGSEWAHWTPHALP